MRTSTAPTWAGVTGVLFDADDTLYDTRSAMHRAGAAAAAALWPTADPDRVVRAGIRFRDDPEGHFAAYTRGEVEFAEMRRARIAELATWLDQPLDDDLWGAFEAAYEPVFLSALTAFDDVAPVVAALRGSGRAVGVLTNSSGAYTAAKIGATGLAHHFDIVCSTDTLGTASPTRERSTRHVAAWAPTRRTRSTSGTSCTPTRSGPRMPGCRPPGSSGTAHRTPRVPTSSPAAECRSSRTCTRCWRSSAAIWVPGSAPGRILPRFA